MFGVKVQPNPAVSIMKLSLMLNDYTISSGNKSVFGSRDYIRKLKLTAQNQNPLSLLKSGTLLWPHYLMITVIKSYG